jgi:hypothetical protein
MIAARRPASQAFYTLAQKINTELLKRKEESQFNVKEYKLDQPYVTFMHRDDYLRKEDYPDRAIKALFNAATQAYQLIDSYVKDGFFRSLKKSNREKYTAALLAIVENMNFLNASRCQLKENQYEYFHLMIPRIVDETTYYLGCFYLDCLKTLCHQGNPFDFVNFVVDAFINLNTQGKKYGQLLIKMLELCLNEYEIQSIEKATEILAKQVETAPETLERIIENAKDTQVRLVICDKRNSDYAKMLKDEHNVLAKDATFIKFMALTLNPCEIVKDFKPDNVLNCVNQRMADVRKHIIHEQGKLIALQKVLNDKKADEIKSSSTKAMLQQMPINKKDVAPPLIVVDNQSVAPPPMAAAQALAPAAAGITRTPR